MKCQKCGSEIYENAKFCSKCGTKVEITDESQVDTTEENVKICPKCGQKYPSTIKFCMKDGTPLQDTIESKSTVPSQEKEYFQTKKIEKAKSSKQIIWIVAMLVILVLAGVAGYILYPGIISKKQDVSVTETQKKEDITTKKEETKQPDEKTLQGDINSEIKDNIEKTQENIIEQQLKTSKTTTTQTKKTTTEKQTNRPEVSPNLTKIDPFRLEGNINRALRDEGLKNVRAEVNDNFEVTLKGTVSSNAEKDKALAIAKRFKETKTIKDSIFIVE